ncbi:GNAT family N-acetyltransferase [Methanobrevibacter sp. TMH8]|uniref:GNAT family N-acetyltransferase n=1 Tax=Methanobrevibacter sp. TMH8 TaxID=2848611 RepID=UPI001CCD42A8|nr:GNAT family N-acetyltransferase [Methanobrevibacter sp. TMH8]MBZ9570550.1 GNAT family N-acetyltransferase [Methanobrevibacter sp. TMH8]
MANIDLNKIKIILHDGSDDVSQFDCNHEDINEFIIEDALPQKEIMLNSTYIAKYEENIIGFFTLSADKIKIGKLGEEYKEKFKNKKINYTEFPALKLGRLGVVKQYKGQKIGSFLLRWIFFYGIEMSKNIGFRFITIDSYLGYPYEFYKKNYCKDILNEQNLKKEINTYERLKNRNNPEANKRTVPLFMDLYKFKTLFSQGD